MKKFKNFCQKPITWGSYFKLCGGVLGAYTIGVVAYLVKLKYDDYKYMEELRQAGRERAMFADLTNGSTEDEAN